MQKIKEEFEPERHFATTSAEEMKAEDSCEESRRAELNREVSHAFSFKDASNSSIHNAGIKIKCETCNYILLGRLISFRK